MEEKNNIRSFFSFFFNNNHLGIQTICYSINLVLPTLILLTSSFYGYYVFTAELGIIIGINIIITQIFSANARSIIILKENDELVFEYFFFRILISLILLITNVIIIFTFNFNNQILLILIVLLIIFQWTNEIILCFCEIKNKIFRFYFYLIPTLVLIYFIVCSFNLFKEVFLIITLYNLYLIIFMLINSIGYKSLDIKKNFFKNFKKIIQQTSFFSSFCISFANLIWRLLILSMCGKILAGIYFASFAIGSFPGTIFNISFGPTMLRKNIKFRKIHINSALAIFFICLFVLGYLSIRHKNLIFIEGANTQIFGTFLSLCGSIFMVRGLYFRQYILQKTKFQEKIFKIDILYAFMIGGVVPVLYLIGGEKFIILSFLMSSLISYLLYKFNFNNLIKK